MNRRSFFAASAGAALLERRATAASIPIIDTHIHLFDTNRPQGVPWPPKTNQVLYKPALPGRYRQIAVPLGITGAIKVEASPWLEDNQWVLDLIQNEPLIVGMIGNIEPGKADFAKHLERFRKNRLFLGIRNGNLWGRDLGGALGNPRLLSDTKLLSQAGLTLDSANPNPALLDAILRLSDKAPDLRIVIDHLPQMAMPADAAARRALHSTEREFTKRDRIYVKISSVLRRADGQIPTDLSFYRGRLDEIYGIFGEDRVVFGSDWPNSDNWRPYPDVLRIVQQYFATKTPAQAEKYFWRNSVKAYKWIKRDASQPDA